MEADPAPNRALSSQAPATKAETKATGSVPLFPSAAVNVETCAICEVPIPGRVLFCARHWVLCPVPNQRALTRYAIDPGQSSVQFNAARESAVRIVTKKCLGKDRSAPEAAETEFPAAEEPWNF